MEPSDLQQLKEWAAAQFKIDKPVGGDSKLTRRQSAEIACKAKGISLEKYLGLPDLPLKTIYIYQWFQDIKPARELTYVDIKAWSDLRGVSLTNQELDALMMLEHEFLKSQRIDPKK